MDNKEQWIVAAVTTREAMEVCVSGEAPVFCVENPLFSEIFDKLDTMECLADYDKEIHEEKQIVSTLCFCTRATRQYLRVSVARWCRSGAKTIFATK